MAEKNDPIFETKEARNLYEQMRLAAEQRSKFETEISDKFGNQKRLQAQILDSIEQSVSMSKLMTGEKKKQAALLEKINNREGEMANWSAKRLDAAKEMLHNTYDFGLVEAHIVMEKQLASLGQTILSQKEESLSKLAETLSVFDLRKHKTEEELVLERIRNTLQEHRLDMTDDEIERIESRIDLMDKQLSHSRRLEKVAGSTERVMDRMKETMESLASKAKDFLGSWGFPLGIAALLAGPIILGLRAAFKLFNEIDEAGASFRKNTGLTRSQTADIAASATSIGYAYAGIGVTFEEAYESAQDFLGVFSSALHPTRSMVAQLSVLRENFGIGSQDAAKTMQIIQSMSGASELTAQGMSNVVVQLAEANRVAPAEVFADIAASSDDIAELMRGNRLIMLSSAIEARRMGTSLQDAARSSNSLLDFQSSISKEMEASVLIGQHVNFGYARQLAFEGDIVGAQKEALRVIKSTGDFLGRNVFEKRALAEAAGMTVGEVERLLHMEKALGKLSGNQLDVYTQLTDEMKGQVDFTKEDVAGQIERLSLLQNQKTQMDILKQQWRAIMMSLSSIFVPIIQAGLTILQEWSGEIGNVDNVVEYMSPKIQWIVDKMKLASKWVHDWYVEVGGVQGIFDKIASTVDTIAGYMKAMPGWVAAIGAAFVTYQVAAKSFALWTLIGATGGVGMVPVLIAAGAIGLAGLLAKLFVDQKMRKEQMADLRSQQLSAGVLSEATNPSLETLTRRDDLGGLPGLIDIGDLTPDPSPTTVDAPGMDLPKPSFELNDITTTDVVSKGDIAIAERLDTLIALMQDGFAINMDGYRVGSQVSRRAPVS